MDTKRLIQMMLLLFLSWSSSAIATPIALNIYFDDNSAFSLSEYKKIDAYMQEQLPSHRIKTLYYTLKKPINAESSHIQEWQLMGEPIQFYKDDQITHLVINTHGMTSLGAEGNETSLSAIGQYNVLGVNQSLADFFKPIRNFLAPNVRIIMNACSTAADGNGAFERVEKLAQHLNIPNASLYCATTIERNSLNYNWVSSYNPFKGLTLSDVKIAMAIAIVPTLLWSAVDIYDAFTATINLPTTLSALQFRFIGVSAYTLTTSKILSLAAQKLAASFSKENRGLLIWLRNGKVVTAENIIKAKDLAKLYEQHPELKCEVDLLPTDKN